MKRVLLVLLSALLAGSNTASLAQEKPPEKKEKGSPASAEKPDSKKEKDRDEKGTDSKDKEPPRAEQSATQHTVVIGGAPIAYTATAGTFVLRDAKDEPRAKIGYTDYRKGRRGPEPAADHLRVQRRTGVFVGLAAHGSCSARAES